MRTVSIDSIIVRGVEHVETKSGDQTLMMSVEQGRYYAVDSTAARIWELIEHPIRLGALVDTLIGEYDIDRDTCADQVLSFVSELIDNGLATELEGARST